MKPPLEAAGHPTSTVCDALDVFVEFRSDSIACQAEPDLQLLNRFLILMEIGTALTDGSPRGARPAACRRRPLE